MYTCETLTTEDLQNDECSPFYGECYPLVEGVCGPDCSPEGGCKPDCAPWDVDCGPKID